MYRQIVIPQQTQLLLQLPAEFVGKQVEVIAFTLEKEKPGKHIPDNNMPDQEKEMENFYRSINIDMSKFKFNREKAHER